MLIESFIICPIMIVFCRKLIAEEDAMSKIFIALLKHMEEYVKSEDFTEIVIRRNAWLADILLQLQMEEEKLELEKKLNYPCRARR